MAEPAHVCVGQLSLPCHEVRAPCICICTRPCGLWNAPCTCIYLRLKATWRLATIVKPLAAPRLIVLVWSCKGLDSRLQDRHRVSHRESEALCLRRCVCPGAASHVFDASIAQCSIARGDTAWNSPSRECAPSWHASLQRSPSKLQQIVAVCPDNAMSKVNVAAPQQGLSA